MAFPIERLFKTCNGFYNNKRISSHIRINMDLAVLDRANATDKDTPYSYALGWSSQFYFCTLPFRLDSYRRCEFDCTYCFVTHRGGSFRKNWATARVESVRKQLQGTYPSLISDCVKHRLPLHFGGMSDPFMPIELDRRVTYSILEILAELKYPTVISTKSHLPAENPYFDILKSIPFIALQFSFSTLDDALASKLEPFCPAPSVRLQTMNRLAEAGFWVSCRFQPFIPGVSGNIGNLVRKVAEVGARHIVVEHLKLGLFGSQVILTTLRNHCGESFARDYDLSMLRRVGTEFELDSSYKINNIRLFWEYTRKYGLTLGVGDNDFHDLGDSPNCCGVENLPGFENCYRHNTSNAIWRRDRLGLIKYSSIENEWAPTNSIKRWVNSKCRNGESSTCSSTKDYFKRQWNKLAGTHSPLECANVEYNGCNDDQGNLLYRYQPKFRLLGTMDVKR